MPVWSTSIIFTEPISSPFQLQEKVTVLEAERSAQETVADTAAFDSNVVNSLQTENALLQQQVRRR